MEPEIKIQKDTQLRSTAEMLDRAREDHKRGVMSEVYEWEFPQVLDAPIPVRNVVVIVNKLHQTTLKLSAKYPSWDNVKLREYLRGLSPEFEDLASRTHPHLFTMVADKQLTAQNFKRIQDLMAIRFMHEQHPNTEDNTKLISSYFQNEFYVSTKK
jgi:hypothetical protein